MISGLPTFLLKHVIFLHIYFKTWGDNIVPDCKTVNFDLYRVVGSQLIESKLMERLIVNSIHGIKNGNLVIGCQHTSMMKRVHQRSFQYSHVIKSQ